MFIYSELSDQDRVTTVEQLRKDIECFEADENDRRAQIQSLCDLFDNSMDIMLGAESLYIDNVSTLDERKIVDCVMGTDLESGKSSGESSIEFDQPNNGSNTGSTHDPLTTCASRFLLREWVNYRRTADETAKIAKQRKGPRRYIPLVRRLTEILRDHFSDANDPGVSDDAYYYGSIGIPLKILIYTPTAKLPATLQEPMRQAFPNVEDDVVKVLDEKALNVFKTDAGRAWGLIRALKGWKTVHFEDD